MTILERVRLYAGTYHNAVILQQLMNDAVRLVIGELPEEVLQPIAEDETDDGTGVDVSNKRVLRAHKGGYAARRLNHTVAVRLSTENNTLEATTYEPAYYIKSVAGVPTAYVVPGGGTLVTVSEPTVSVMARAVDGVPSMLIDLFVYRCATLALSERMAKKRDEMTLTVTLPTIPSGPLAPMFTYNAATAIAPSVTAIADLPDAPSFLKPSEASLPTAPTVPAAPDTSGAPDASTGIPDALASLPTVGTLDLSTDVGGNALTPPTPPDAPDLTYLPAEATAGASVTVDTLPTLPQLSAPPVQGDFALPSIPAVDLSVDIHGASIVFPTPPLAPAVAGFDAEAQAVVPSSLESAAAAPSLVVPPYEGDLSAPTLPTLSFSEDVVGASIVAPTLPAVPDAPFLAAVSPSIAATAVGALPTAPVLSSAAFAGDIAKIAAALPAVFSSSASAPTPPTLGEIVYVPPSVGTLGTTQIAALPTLGALVPPVFGGDLSLIASEIPASFTPTATPPTAPTAPDLTYLPPQLGSLAQTSVGSVPSTPTMGLVAFEGDLASVVASLPSALDLDAEGLTPPDVPTTIPVVYTAADATTAVSESVVIAALPKPPVLSIGDIALSRTDFDSYTAQEDPEMMGILLNEVSVQVQEFSADANAKLQLYSQQIEAWRGEIQASLQNLQQAQEAAMLNARQATEVAIRNASEAASVQLRSEEMKLRTYDSEAQVYMTRVNAVIAEFRANLERATQAIATQQSLYLQKYAEDMRHRQTQHTSDVQTHLREIDRLIEQARLDQERLRTVYQTEADFVLRNAAQTAQLEIAAYEAELSGYRTEVEGYATEVNAEIQTMRANLDRVAQGVAQQQALHVQLYAQDAALQLRQYEGVVQDHMREIDRLIEQARLDQERLRIAYETETNVDVQNAIQDVQTTVARYEQLLAKYRTDADVYRVTTEAEAIEVNANLARITQGIVQEQTLYLQKYQAEAEQNVIAFNAAVQRDLAEVEVAVTDARLAHERLLASAEAELTVEQQNKARISEIALRNYEQALVRYGNSIQDVQARVQAVLAEWEAGYRAAIEPWLERQRLYFQKYTAEWEASLGRYRGEIDVWRSLEERKAAQLQTTLQEALEDARAGTAVATQNATRRLEAAVAQYDREIARFQAQSAVSQQRLESAVREYELSYQRTIEPWLSQQRLLLESRQQEVQLAQSEWQGIVQDHMAAVERLRHNAELEAQRLQQNAQRATEVSVRNAAEGAALAVQQYGHRLALHANQLRLYEAQVGAKLQEFQAGLGMQVQLYAARSDASSRIYEARVAGQARAYEARVGSEIRAFEAEVGADVALYQAQSQVEITLFNARVQSASTELQARIEAYRAAVQKNALAAQIAAQEANQTASQSTEVAVVNAARQLEAQVQQYSAVLGKHRQELEAFSAETQARIATLQTEHNVVMDLFKTMNFDLARVRRMYDETRNAYMRFFWPHRSYTIMQPII